MREMFLNCITATQSAYFKAKITRQMITFCSVFGEDSICSLVEQGSEISVGMSRAGSLKALQLLRTDNQAWEVNGIGFSVQNGDLTIVAVHLKLKKWILHDSIVLYAFPVTFVIAKVIFSIGYPCITRNSVSSLVLPTNSILTGNFTRSCKVLVHIFQNL